MHDETTYYSRTLTGNYYFKPTILGGLILMVEVDTTFSDKETPDKHRHFVKGSFSDLFNLGLTSNPKLIHT